MARELQEILDSGELDSAYFSGKLEVSDEGIFRNSDLTCEKSDSSGVGGNIRAEAAMAVGTNDNGNSVIQLNWAGSGTPYSGYGLWVDNADDGKIKYDSGSSEGYTLWHSGNKTFDYAIVNDVDITTTEPDWTDLLTLVTSSREAGTYLGLFSLQFHMNSTSQSFYYRFSLDGGATWGPEYLKEVKDRSNVEVIEVSKLIVHTGGAMDIRCQVTREGSATCEVREAFMSVERKA